MRLAYWHRSRRRIRSTSRRSEAKVAEKLDTGMTTGGDRVGGPMVEVARGTSQLNAEDRAAMAAYIKSLPAL